MDVPAGATGTPLADIVVIYVLCPLIVLLISAVVAWTAHLSARLSRLDRQQGVIMAQVNPPGEPSLRALIADTREDIATIRAGLRR